MLAPGPNGRLVAFSGENGSVGATDGGGITEKGGVGNIDGESTERQGRTAAARASTAATGTATATRTTTRTTAGTTTATGTAAAAAARAATTPATTEPHVQDSFVCKLSGH